MFFTMPYENFEKSAKVLSTPDLKRVMRTIVQTLEARSEGELLVPLRMRKMWSEHWDILANYGIQICYELMRRDETVKSSFNKLRKWTSGRAASPVWMNDRKFFQAQRGWLVGRNPQFYKKVFRVKPCKPNWPSIKIEDVVRNYTDLLELGWQINVSKKPDQGYRCEYYLGSRDLWNTNPIVGVGDTILGAIRGGAKVVCEEYFA